MCWRIQGPRVVEITKNFSTPRCKAPKRHMLAEWEASNLYVCPKSRAWVANEAGSRHVAISGTSSTTPDHSQPPPALKVPCRRW